MQRFVRKGRGAQVPEARVVIVTAPGQEAQVDYGTGPMVRDPESRKYRRTLGGATRIVVLDNLREGVLVPDICVTSKIYPTFRSLSASNCLIVR